MNPSGFCPICTWVTRSRGSTQVSALRPLIAGAGTVIFNGDTWQELAAAVFRTLDGDAGGARSRSAARKARRRFFYPGNHDPGWPGPGWVELAGGRIVITHGDALLFDGSPWKREILVSRQRVTGAMGPTSRRRPEMRRTGCRRPGNRPRTLLGRVSRPAATFSPTGMGCGPAAKARGQDDRGLAHPRLRGREILCAIISRRRRCSLSAISTGKAVGCANGRRIINTGSFMARRDAPTGWNGTRAGSAWGLIDESPESCRKGQTLDVWRFEPE